MQIFALVFSANTRHKVAHTCRQPQDNQDMCKCVGWVGIRQMLLWGKNEIYSSSDWVSGDFLSCTAGKNRFPFEV